MPPREPTLVTMKLLPESARPEAAVEAVALVAGELMGIAARPEAEGVRHVLTEVIAQLTTAFDLAHPWARALRDHVMSFGEVRVEAVERHRVSERNVIAFGGVGEGGSVHVVQKVGTLPAWAVLELDSRDSVLALVGELVAHATVAWPDQGYACPRCKRVSFNPHDALHRYCGACKAFEGTGP